jgi:hypothetical protein
MRPLCRQFGLNCIKELAVHERRLWAWVDLILVSNLSHIEMVTQNVEEGTLREMNPATDAAIRQFAELGSKVARSQVSDQPVHASQLQVAPEYCSDLLGLLLDDEKLSVL